MELDYVSAKVSRPYVGYSVVHSASYRVREALALVDAVLCDIHTKSEDIVHLEVCLCLRYYYVDYFLEFLEAHGFHLLEYLVYNDSHSLGSLIVVSYTLSDTSVGYGLNSAESLFSGTLAEMIF